MMNLRENDFLGIDVNEVLATLEDLGIEVTYIDEDEDEVIRIDTTIGYVVEFHDNICHWSGYEKDE